MFEDFNLSWFLKYSNSPLIRGSHCKFTVFKIQFETLNFAAFGIFPYNPREHLDRYSFKIQFTKLILSNPWILVNMCLKKWTFSEHRESVSPISFAYVSSIKSVPNFHGFRFSRILLLFGDFL